MIHSGLLGRRWDHWQVQTLAGPECEVRATLEATWINQQVERKNESLLNSVNKVYNGVVSVCVCVGVCFMMFPHISWCLINGISWCQTRCVMMDHVSWLIKWDFMVVFLDVIRLCCIPLWLAAVDWVCRLPKHLVDWMPDVPSTASERTPPRKHRAKELEHQILVPKPKNALQDLQRKPVMSSE